jgi:hypothetical protein
MAVATDEKPEASARGFAWATSGVLRVGDKMRISLALLAGLLTSKTTPESISVGVKAITDEPDTDCKVVLVESLESTDEETKDEIPIIIVLSRHGCSPKNRIIIGGRDITQVVRSIDVRSSADSMTTISLGLRPDSVRIVASVPQTSIGVQAEALGR